ncbi:hypothetical protein ACU8V3_09605 [Cobetia marina]
MSEKTALSEKNAMNQPAETPMPSATVEMEVPFHDVDMMEVAWHGHYVRYLEIARCKLLTCSTTTTRRCAIPAMPGR